ncbi:MAG: hypothetical protein COT24_01890 [Candidatus Kerfeldbacteria bacterium CG08_land_8_20_14_0_20_40_16]|uniref:Zinc-ribbon 15 domain-containing protein n=1 Tax=Candidatus Kerfeldbacteria bacterium CG08_land_8_20_14_0_20_40_16 TaxID=2014244 RepID=A0A2H0YWR5_9BACT|nr:MAG: hypothetical protein COT24_01890 [Candidatus Kerfeldbacteria bacterium CG08_land_8_20_14_0_20_40_16]
MIIFGWGHQKTKNYGPVFEYTCSNCHNKNFWQLVSISTWFTLFFIPIFPYENKHLLICPVCTYGAKIERKEVENLKQLANFNSDLINGRITDQEHKQKVRATLENKQLIDTSLSNSNTRPTNQSSKALHCKYCAYKNVSKAGFCRNCGKKLNNN